MKELTKYVVYNVSTKEVFTRELKSEKNAELLSKRRANAAVGKVVYQYGKLIKTEPEGLKLI